MLLYLFNLELDFQDNEMGIGIMEDAEAYKNIHMGSLIKQRVEELKFSLSHVSNIMSLTEKEIKEIYTSEYVDIHYLLCWSKFLKYDFFEIYSHYLRINSLLSPTCLCPKSQGRYLCIEKKCKSKN